MEIKNVIREARQKAGLTQEEAAEKILVTRQTISNWENGKSLPDIDSVLKMSDLYRVSLDELLKGDQKMVEKIEKESRYLRERNSSFGMLMLGLAMLGVSSTYYLFKQMIPAGISITDEAVRATIIAMTVILCAALSIGLYVLADKKQSRGAAKIAMFIPFVLLSLIFLDNSYSLTESLYLHGTARIVLILTLTIFLMSFFSLALVALERKLKNRQQ